MKFFGRNKNQRPVSQGRKLIESNSKLTQNLGNDLDKAIESLQKKEFYIPTSTLEKQELIAFEQSRLEYCIKLYELEVDRQKELEKKAQFYLSIITIFIGALLFKFDFINTLADLFANKANVTPDIILILAKTFLSSILISVIVLLFSIFWSMFLRKYPDPAPANIKNLLFGMQSVKSMLRPWFSNRENILRAMSLFYINAAELSKEVNAKKSLWVKIASLAALSLTISIVILLSLIVFWLLFT